MRSTIRLCKTYYYQQDMDQNRYWYKILWHNAPRTSTVFHIHSYLDNGYDCIVLKLSQSFILSVEFVLRSLRHQHDALRFYESARVIDSQRISWAETN